MADFLTHLVGRTLGVSQTVKPRLEPMFAPPAALANEAGPSLLEPNDQTSSPVAVPSRVATAADSLVESDQLPPVSSPTAQPNSPPDMPTSTTPNQSLESSRQNAPLPTGETKAKSLVEPAGKPIDEPPRQPAPTPSGEDLPGRPHRASLSPETTKRQPPPTTPPTPAATVSPAPPAGLPEETLVQVDIEPTAANTPPAAPVSQSSLLLPPEKPAQTQPRPGRSSEQKLAAPSEAPLVFPPVSGPAAEPVETRPRPAASIEPAPPSDLATPFGAISQPGGSPGDDVPVKAAPPALARPVEPWRRPDTPVKPGAMPPVEPIPAPPTQSRLLIPPAGPLVPLADSLAPVEPAAQTGRRQSVPQAAVSLSTEPPGETSTLQVTIGRVEVRAVNPPAPRPAPPRSRPVLSLDSYLKQRRERRR